MYYAKNLTKSAGGGLQRFGCSNNLCPYLGPFQLFYFSFLLALSFVVSNWTFFVYRSFLYIYSFCAQFISSFVLHFVILYICMVCNYFQLFSLKNPYFLCTPATFICANVTKDLRSLMRDLILNVSQFSPQSLTPLIPYIFFCFFAAIRSKSLENVKKHNKT